MRTAPTFRRGVAPDPLAKASAERIIDIRRWTEKLFSLRVTRAPGFRFVPGQWVRLGIPSGGDLPGGVIWRPYSIVSADHDDHLEFFSIVVPDGAFTSRLTRAAIGDTLYVEKQAYGFLTTARFTGGSDLWLLASGTGVAPFLSILRDPAVWQQYQNRILAYSVREARELAYLDEIHALAADPLLGDGRSTLRLVPIVTREKLPDTLGERLPVLLRNGELERAAGLPLDVARSRLLVCGNPAMLDDVRDALNDLGLRSDRSREPGQFATENYW
ncbi:MAG: ferredoxin--NADP reductase [Proteobacteria bacterium]|nr:ferredoxin--NADP reductase [Pseudomonadota bacterium]HQR04087.1 ferredoxin--NADP reductase [Rhodocyclaceae bacterium]